MCVDMHLLALFVICILVTVTLSCAPNPPARPSTTRISNFHTNSRQTILHNNYGKPTATRIPSRRIISTTKKPSVTTPTCKPVVSLRKKDVQDHLVFFYKCVTNECLGFTATCENNKKMEMLYGGKWNTIKDKVVKMNCENGDWMFSDENGKHKVDKLNCVPAESTEKSENTVPDECKTCQSKDSLMEDGADCSFSEEQVDNDKCTASFEAECKNDKKPQISIKYEGVWHESEEKSVTINCQKGEWMFYDEEGGHKVEKVKCASKEQTPDECEKCPSKESLMKENAGFSFSEEEIGDNKCASVDALCTKSENRISIMYEGGWHTREQDLATVNCQKGVWMFSDDNSDHKVEQIKCAPEEKASDDCEKCPSKEPLMEDGADCSFSEEFVNEDKCTAFKAECQNDKKPQISIKYDGVWHESEEKSVTINCQKGEWMFSDENGGHKVEKVKCASKEQAPDECKKCQSKDSLIKDGADCSFSGELVDNDKCTASFEAECKNDKKPKISILYDKVWHKIERNLQMINCQKGEWMFSADNVDHKVEQIKCVEEFYMEKPARL